MGRWGGIIFCLHQPAYCLFFGNKKHFRTKFVFRTKLFMGGNISQGPILLCEPKIQKNLGPKFFVETNILALSCAKLKGCSHVILVQGVNLTIVNTDFTLFLHFTSTPTSGILRKLIFYGSSCCGITRRNIKKIIFF